MYAIISEIISPFISTRNSSRVLSGFPFSNLACLKFVFLDLGGYTIVRREQQQQESNNRMAKWQIRCKYCRVYTS